MWKIGVFYGEDLEKSGKKREVDGQVERWVAKYRTEMGGYERDGWLSREVDG
jgi:hypothetical protein